MKSEYMEKQILNVHHRNCLKSNASAQSFYDTPPFSTKTALLDNSVQNDFHTECCC